MNDIKAKAVICSTEPPAITLDELEIADIDAMYCADEPTTYRPQWRIADDGCADWAVRKLAEEKAELDRIKILADEQTQRIKEKVKLSERRYENSTAFLTGKLQEYFETVPHRSTAIQQSYRLLSGSLIKKLGGPSMTYNSGKLLEWLKSCNLSDYVKVEESPMWGELKKKLKIIGSFAVIEDTGEVVEGVEIVEKPDVFIVTTTKERKI